MLTSLELSTVNHKWHSTHPSENFREFCLSYQEKTSLKLILRVFYMSVKTPVGMSFMHSKALYYVIFLFEG